MAGESLSEPYTTEGWGGMGTQTGSGYNKQTIKGSGYNKQTIKGSGYNKQTIKGSGYIVGNTGSSHN